MRESKAEKVCVCVCVRERERERMKVWKRLNDETISKEILRVLIGQKREKKTKKGIRERRGKAIEIIT